MPTPSLCNLMHTHAHTHCSAGDPAMVHSMYIAVVLPWQQTISSSSLVSWGRLGSKVRKNTLLCSVDGSGDLKLFTLQWSGIS